MIGFEGEKNFNPHYMHLMISKKYDFLVLISGQEIQRTVNSGQMIMWYLRHLDQKITALSYAVHNQNEISETNTKAFGEFKNAFRGKDVVITGSGPTLKYYKPIPGAIHIGLNFTYRIEHFPLDYRVLVDLPRGSKSEAEFIAEQEKVKAKVKHKIFIRQNKNIPGDPNSPSELLSCISDKVVRFFSGGRTLQNICHHSLNEVYNVAAPAFHFALFTYPKRIFWVGCDSNFIGHFYDKPTQIKDPMFYFYTTKALTNYGAMKMFAKDHYPDTEIISINPVKLRGLFKDVYTDEYLSSVEKSKGGGSRIRDNPCSISVERIAA